MRSQKGSITSWLVFIVVIIVVFGGLFYLKNQSKVATESTTVDVAEEDKKPSKPFATKDLTEEDKEELDNSALNKAVLAGSAEECEAITYNKELQQKCLDSVNYALILKSGDEKQCEKLFDPELKQTCYDKIYYSVALDDFDTSLCKKIKDSALRTSCLSKLQSIFGRTATSEEDCDSITDPSAKQDCLDNFLLSSSVKTLDTESCEDIEDVQLREQCLGTISQNLAVIAQVAEQAASAPKTTQEVLNVCDTQECKDSANYDLAYEKMDLSYCSKIVDSNTKQDCIKEQGEKIDQYYYRKAIGTRDSSLCNSILNTDLKTLCINLI